MNNGAVRGRDGPGIVIDLDRFRPRYKRSHEREELSCPTSKLEHGRGWGQKLSKVLELKAVKIHAGRETFAQVGLPLSAPVVWVDFKGVHEKFPALLERGST